MRRAGLAVVLLAVAAIGFALWSGAGGGSGDGGSGARSETHAAGTAATAATAPEVADASATAPIREEIAAEPGATTAEDGAETLEAELLGIVRRPSDESVVREGVVEIWHTELPREPGAQERWRALDDEERLALRFPAEAEIGEDGRFRLALPWPGIVHVAVVKPKLDQGNAEPQFLETEIELGDLALDRDRPLELDLVVDEGASIAGIVVDATSGLPIERAQVAAPWWSEAWSDWVATTGADGSFRIAGIRREVAAAGASSDLVARADGYVERRLDVPPPPFGLDVSGVRIELQRGIVVRGRIAAAEPGPARLEAVLYSRTRDGSSHVRRLRFLRTARVDHARFGTPGIDARTVVEFEFAFAPVPVGGEAWIDVAGVIPVRTAGPFPLEAEPPAILFDLPASTPIWIPDADRYGREAPGGTERCVLAIVGDVAVNAGERPTLRIDGVSDASRAVPIEVRAWAVERTNDGDWRRGMGSTVIEAAPRSDSLIPAVEVPMTYEPCEAPAPFGTAGHEAELGARLGLGLRIDFDLLDPAGRPLASTRVAIEDVLLGERAQVVTTQDGRISLLVALGRRFLRLRIPGFAAEELEVQSIEPESCSFALRLREPG